MDSFFLENLSPPYNSLAKEEKWPEYIALLGKEGLTWWFNMEILLLAVHLIPLASLPKKFRLPLRIIFFTEAVKGFMSTENMEALYHSFLKRKDFEAAAAAAGAGVASIWDSGSEFKRYEVWDKRIDELLKKNGNLSSLARASLLGFKALIEITYYGDLSKAEEILKSQLFWADKANSKSLRVFHAVALGYCFAYSGDFQKFDVIITDTLPLCNHRETSFICKIYFKLLQGLLEVIKREISAGKKVLREVIEHPLYQKLPPSICLLGYGHLLLAAAFEGNFQEDEEISKIIQDRIVLEQNHFHQGYAHFNMGISSLVLGRPYKALLHGQQVAEKSRLCQSPIPERLSALLIGQALSDLGRMQEALDHFLPWLEKWKNAGYYMFAVHGNLEVANILSKKGKLEEARKYYEKAVNLLPKGEQIPIIYRHPEFFQKLKQLLYPDAKETKEMDQEDVYIHIQTFGELVVQIGNQVIYDRKWHGGRTKALLKALIIYGGNKISEDTLIDTLWPDVDGDLAINNLKVALSRLRRIGCEKGQEPIPWIAVRHRHVSLVKSLCRVDAIEFKMALSGALKEKDEIDLLIKALDLYQDDFLPNDSSELWIIRHREILREEFVKGVLILTERCLRLGKPEKALPYLHKAIEKDPINEELYVNLMKIYLKIGYPSQALKVFNQAKEILKRELAVEPGFNIIALAQEASKKR